MHSGTAKRDRVRQMHLEFEIRFILFYGMPNQIQCKQTKSVMTGDLLPHVLWLLLLLETKEGNTILLLYKFY